MRPLSPSPSYSASRPLFIEHADKPLYRFTKQASAFLCEFRGQSYAVTARHVLKHAGAEYNADQIRIPVRDGITEFLRYDYHWEVPRPDELKDEFNDLLLLRLTTPINAPWADDRAPLRPMTPMLASSSFVLGGDLVVSGYPGIGQNEVDYEKDAITNQRFIVQCEYDGPSGRYLHALRVRQTGVLPDFGGFSGGIVIARLEQGLVPAGVVITGSAVTNVLRFVDAEALYLSLDNFFSHVGSAG